LKVQACQPSRYGKLAFVLALVLMPILTILAGAQAVTIQRSHSFYQSLDRQSAEAKDTATIRTLMLEIHNRNLFGPMPQSVLERMIRAQAGFTKGKHAPVTETAVANAVNSMGRALDPVTFTGTNALQVRLLRIGLLPSFPNLLATGSPRPPDKIVANDLSPAGAIYLGLLLLRQKLANPAWFGDPDTQNQLWLSAKPKTPNAGSILRDEEPPEQTNFRLALQKGFINEGSSTTKAYHHFLDALGVNK